MKIQQNYKLHQDYIAAAKAIRPRLIHDVKLAADWLIEENAEDQAYASEQLVYATHGNHLYAGIVWN